MKFKFLLLFLFGFLFINNTANANIKIVYIDTSLLIQKSNAAIKINKKLQGIHNANISKINEQARKT
jgi:Skp family chaperone for outer membrane proteins